MKSAVSAALVWLVMAQASAAPMENGLHSVDAEALYETYETWMPLAEAIGQAEAEIDFQTDILEILYEDEGIPNEVSAHIAVLDDARRQRLQRVIASFDPLLLLEQAPQTANFLTRVVRLNADAVTSVNLMEALAPLAGTFALHTDVYEGLRSLQLQAHSQSSAPPTRTTPITTIFADRYTRDIEIVRSLGRIRGRDLFIRELFVPLLAQLPTNEVQALIRNFGPRIAAVDQNNTQQALTILNTQNFETLYERAPSAIELITALVHHGGTPEEKSYILALIEPLALQGRFDGQRYALMYDRIAENEGRPQRYGTQDACVNGQRTLHTIEDPDNVDTRRSEMGMEPLATYRARLIEMYGEQC